MQNIQIPLKPLLTPSPNPNTLYFFLLMTLIILVFNWNSISLDAIIANDYTYTSILTTDSVLHLKKEILSRGIAFSSIINHYIFVYCVPISPKLARSIIVIFGLIPVSLLCFILYRDYFKLPPVVAFFSATLPQILPNQTYIPIYINGGYFGYMLLPFFIFVLFCIKYVRSENQEKKIYFLLNISLILSFLATELSLFLLAPAVLLILVFARSWKKIFHVLGPMVLFSSLKVFWYMTQEHGIANTVVFNDWDRIVNSIGIQIKTILPFLGNFLTPEVMGIFLMVMILSVVWVFTLFGKRFIPEIQREGIFLGRKMVGDILKDRSGIAILFGVIWIISTTVPFVLLSGHPFSSRYAYPSGFGFALLFGAIPYYFLGSKGNRSFFLKVILIALLIFSGIQRLQSIESIYGPTEKINQIIRGELRLRQFPLASSIVIVGKEMERLRTAGVMSWSKGYLRYTLNRKDVRGLIGPKYSFYNPFKQWTGSWSEKMVGIPLREPIFLFEYIPSEEKLKQYAYFLVWERDEGRWAIFKADQKTGQISGLIRGKGPESFETAKKFLGEKDIDPSEIYWYFDSQKPPSG